jgi:hypothetical protein
MTTDQYGGYQPPAGEPTAPYPHETTGSQSTTAQAKDQASNVASTATDQARNVAGEAKTQARNLLHETQGQVREQAGQQKQKASGGLRSLSDELRSVANGTGTPQDGMLGDLARQASDRAQEFANWLDDREPGDLVGELRDFARRKPGTFLLGAAVAGVLAGRLTRSAVDVKRQEGDSGTSGYASGDYSGSTYGGTTPSTAGSEWADATSTADPTPTEAVVVEEVDVVSVEPYATTGGRHSGGDVQ